MSNLLEETKRELSMRGLSFDDVRWVGSSEYEINLDDFIRLADVEYDSGYGGQEVAEDLLIVGDDWWLSRGEYDGSEWWDFNRKPKKPENIIQNPVALCRSQAEEHGCWTALSELNGL